MLRHEGDAVQLREKVVQTLHTGTKRKVGTVQAGLYVVPGISKRQTRISEIKYLFIFFIFYE